MKLFDIVYGGTIPDDAWRTCRIGQIHDLLIHIRGDPEDFGRLFYFVSLFSPRASLILTQLAYKCGCRRIKESMTRKLEHEERARALAAWNKTKMLTGMHVVMIQL